MQNVRTSEESRYLASIRQRLCTLKHLLDEQSIPNAGDSAQIWYQFLLAMKEISGNANNAMSFVAGLMAKDYFLNELPMQPFDFAAKAQGASGLDIDARTLDGKRVIGEVKRTIPYKPNDLGSNQKDKFKEDFAKLQYNAADHKFLFVTDKAVWQLMTDKYSSYLSGVTVVLLLTSEACLI